MSKKIRGKHEESNVLLNYSEGVVNALSRARLMADELYSDTVTPLLAMFGIMLEPECPLNDYFIELGIGYRVPVLISAFLSCEEVYELVTKEKYPVSYEDDESTEMDDGGEGESKNNSTARANEKYVEAKSDANVAKEGVETNSATSEDEEAENNFVASANEEGTDTESDENQNIGQRIMYIDINQFSDMMEENFAINRSSELSEILQRTASNSYNSKQQYIDVCNLFYQLLVSGDEQIEYVIKELMEIDLVDLSKFVAKKSRIYADVKKGKLALPQSLRGYCTILNDKFTAKTSCDILGREDEIALVWNIFSKKTKSNVILVGDPGVGKTAIMEAITLSIVQKTCPKKFRKYSVVELNIISMMSGTKYRGELEEKIENFITFLEGVDNVIVYVDEVHHLVGTGSSEGSAIDMSGALKPILARDNVIFVGATTTSEYEKILSRDGAFERRFEVVEVEEPRHDKVKAMIQKRVETLEKYHKVSVTESMLDRILILAQAFNCTTSNPDKSIDLLDRSMAQATLCNSSELKEEHVQAIFAKNFKQFEAQSKKYNKAIAIHEAGHYVAIRTLEDILHYNMILVSVIPTGDTAGVNMYELPEVPFGNTDMEYINAQCMVSLAGRAAEEVFGEPVSAGAASDLQHANTHIEHMLVQYGMYRMYPNVVVSLNFDGRNQISEDSLNRLFVQKTRILEEIYQKTIEMLTTNKEKINCIATALVEKKIMTADELDMFYRKVE